MNFQKIASQRINKKLSGVANKRLRLVKLKLRLVFTSDGVRVGVVIRSVALDGLVKTEF